MQRVAWVLLLGWLVGCGGTPIPTVTAEATKPKAVVVPAEVELLFDRGELTSAIELLSMLIEKTPRDESLYSLRATAHHRLGHHNDALADLDQAISLSDRDANLFNNRGFIRLGLQQFQAALQDFDKALELAPRYTNVFNNRGLLFIAQGKFTEAIEQFNRALEIDDQYIDAYNNRGFAEFQSDQIGQALDDFNVALQLNPEYVNAYNNRGLLRARAGDFENALIDFTQAMMIEPLNPKYYEHRRDLYQKQGAYDKAVADDRKIVWLVEYHQLTAEIAASTDPAIELTQRAKHFMKIDEQEKALDDLNRAVSLDPTFVDALVARANVHLSQKSMDKAKADAEASLAITAKTEAYSILGDVFLDLGDYDRAIENFARARRIDASVADAYYAKSKSLAKQGQQEQAQDNLQQALALDPDVESRLR